MVPCMDAVVAVTVMCVLLHVCMLRKCKVAMVTEMHVCMLRKCKVAMVTEMLVWGIGGGVVVVSAGHVGGTHDSGIVSSATNMLGMSMVCGMRGVAGVCEMCICLALGWRGWRGG